MIIHDAYADYPETYRPEPAAAAPAVWRKAAVYGGFLVALLFTAVLVVSILDATSSAPATIAPIPMPSPARPPAPPAVGGPVVSETEFAPVEVAL